MIRRFRVTLCSMSERPREGTGLLFPAESAGDVPRPDAPLADRVRPRTLDEILGQEEALGPDTPLGRAILADRIPSIILWGPPGSGKTTLAHVVRRLTSAHFEALSAVLSEIDEIAKATFSSITFATMLRLIERQQREAVAARTRERARTAS